MPRRLLPLAILLTTLSCAENETLRLDGGGARPDRVTTADSGDVGVEARDSAIRDADLRDVGPSDLGDDPRDAESHDGARRDARPGDANFTDADPRDAHLPDVAPRDSGGPGGALCSDNPVTPDAVCDRTDAAQLCGNGQRDTCIVCSGGGLGFRVPPPFDAGPACEDRVEACDGTDMGGASCGSLGFASGNLGCGLWCGYDTTTCSSCVAQMGTRCADVDVGQVNVQALALAEGHGEIAMAWAAQGEDARVRFYQADLTEIGEAECGFLSQINDLALAPAPGGWVLAAQGQQGLVLQLLDRSGAVVSARSWSQSAFAPHLIEQEGSWPLLIYAESGPGGSSMRAAQLTRGLSPAWQVAFANGVTEPHLGSAVFDGASYITAFRIQSSVVLQRIDLAGQMSMPVTIATSAEYPQIAWTGTGARVVYASFSGPAEMRWQRLDANLNAVAPPVSLGGIPTYFNPSPVLALGEDTLVLLGRYTGGTAMAAALDYQRLNPLGGPVGSARTLNRDPNSSTKYRWVRSGDAAYAAWIGSGFPGRVGLTRVTP